MTWIGFPVVPSWFAARSFEQVGMLDQRFFYYWEETEWCVRTKKAGWRIVHVPQAKLWHKGVQRDYKPSPSVTYYSTRNRLMMLAKHHAPLGGLGCGLEADTAHTAELEHPAKVAQYAGTQECNVAGDDGLSAPSMGACVQYKNRNEDTGSFYVVSLPAQPGEQNPGLLPYQGPGPTA